MAVLKMLLLFVCLTVNSYSGANSLEVNSVNGTGRPQTSESVNCSHGEDLKLVVVGTNNETGQPRVQARLEHPAGRQPWQLELFLRDTPCPDGESRRVMQVTLFGPIQGDYLPTPQRLQQVSSSQLNEFEILETSVVLADNGTSSNSSWTESPQPRSRRLDDPWDVDMELNEVTSQFGGFRKIPGLGRYKVKEGIANWTQAAMICLREKAILAFPNSQAEADALWQLKQQAAPMPAEGARGAFGMALAGMLNRAYLVGGGSMSPGANFTTIFGEELEEAGYNTWAVPYTPETGSCLAMYENMGLFAVECQTEMSFICELPI